MVDMSRMVVLPYRLTHRTAKDQHDRVFWWSIGRLAMPT
jgi:hypothetical protein